MLTSGKGRVMIDNNHCESLVLFLYMVLKLNDVPATYYNGGDEWTIAWFDEEGYRNSLSCWTDDDEGIWSKCKKGVTSDEFEFNVLTDNYEDIINRILGI